MAGHEKTFGALHTFREGWMSTEWGWEDYFQCVASKFAASDTDKARGLVQAAMPIEWSQENIAEAPDHVRRITEGTGGLRSGQLLFVSELESGSFSYAMWWPWNSGDTVSLRIGFAGEASEKDVLEFRALFGT